MSTIAIYPGTFDPVTNGHLDVIERAGRIFDSLVVAVAAENGQKRLLFSVQERLGLIRENIVVSDRLQLMSFSGLLVDFANQIGARVLIRGLRAVSDFEFEFEMTQMNRLLDARLETVFLMPTQDYFFTRSGLVKQVAEHTSDLGRIANLIPSNVMRALESMDASKQLK